VAQIGGVTVVLTGDPVCFSAAATDPEGKAGDCLWDFADGGTSTECDPCHVFADCGAYPVSVTVSDGVTANSVTTRVAVACALSATNVQARLNFAEPNLDSLRLKATPHPSQCTNWLGVAVTVDVGGAQVSFTLNEKGRGVSDQGTCRFTYSKKTGVCTFTARLSHGSWQTPWAPLGLVNATVVKPGVDVTLPVILVIGDEAFMADNALHYTATADKSGTAK
jgi:PKD repeat protein